MLNPSQMINHFHALPVHVCYLNVYTMDSMLLAKCTAKPCMKIPDTATVDLLALATLGEVRQIQPILFRIRNVAKKSAPNLARVFTEKLCIEVGGWLSFCMPSDQ